MVTVYIFTSLFFPHACYGVSPTGGAQWVMCWFAEAKMKLGCGGGCQLLESWLPFLHTQLPSDFIEAGIFVSLICYWRLLLCCPLKLWALCKQVCLWVCLPPLNIYWVLSEHQLMNTGWEQWVLSLASNLFLSRVTLEILGKYSWTTCLTSNNIHKRYFFKLVWFHYLLIQSFCQTYLAPKYYCF